MLNKPSPQVLAALATLDGNPDFEVIKYWLSEALQNLDADARETQDNTVCRWRQGAAQAVADFLSYAQRAQEIIRKSR